jgi:hypothetical protein
MVDRSHHDEAVANPVHGDRRRVGSDSVTAYFGPSPQVDLADGALFVIGDERKSCLQSLSSKHEPVPVQIETDLLAILM